jgi:triacylglycerol lipase
METFYFQSKAFGYHPNNAYSLALVSALAYERNKQVAEQTAKDWGFERIFFFDRGGTQAILLADQEKIIVGFRGTEPDLLSDWITDAKIRKTAGPGGNVHRGFKEALNWIWLDVEKTIEWLREALPKEKQQTLWFTGHSLGGALATMAAAFCKFNEDPIILNGLYTYGQPRVGSEKFAANFNTAFKSQSFRFVNDADVVTRVPPSICDYSHIGQLKYFDRLGNVQSDGDLSWWSTFWDRVEGELDNYRNRSPRGYQPNSVADHDLSGRYIPRLKSYRDKWEAEQQRQSGTLFR